MAQPFRMMAHDGELNTDRKNRLADDAGARARLRRIVRPPGQSDNRRPDQTLESGVFDDLWGCLSDDRRPRTLRSRRRPRADRRPGLPGSRRCRGGRPR